MIFELVFGSILDHPHLSYFIFLFKTKYSYLIITILSLIQLSLALVILYISPLSQLLTREAHSSFSPVPTAPLQPIPPLSLSPAPPTTSSASPLGQIDLHCAVAARGGAGRPPRRSLGRDPSSGGATSPPATVGPRCGTSGPGGACSSSPPSGSADPPLPA
jgi:hypothetical protein